MWAGFDIRASRCLKKKNLKNSLKVSGLKKKTAPNPHGTPARPWLPRQVVHQQQAPVLPLVDRDEEEPARREAPPRPAGFQPQMAEDGPGNGGAGGATCTAGALMATHAALFFGAGIFEIPEKPLVFLFLLSFCWSLLLLAITTMQTF